MMKMRKLDSFVKEVLRYNTSIRTTLLLTWLTQVGSKRRVMKPFKFSDGLILSPGEIIASDQRGIHMDETNYPNAQEFDGFRFSRLREDGQSSKAYTTNTSTEFLTFGHGKHAW